MENPSEYERPNTVFGLVAKRTQLIALRRTRKEEIKRINANIAHLEAAIKLFDLGGELTSPRKPYEPRGAIKRTILTVFREAEGPLTSKQIVERWAKHNGLELDPATYAKLRKRIAPCIRTCADQGLIEDRGWTPAHNGKGPFKLWAVKEGGL